jgi:O-antigen ligase
VSLAYIGVLIYCMILYIRPQDWVGPVLHWRLELVVAGGATALALLQRRPRFPLQVPLLAAWVVVIFLSNATGGHMEFVVRETVKYFKLAIVFVMFWAAVDSTAKLRGVMWLLVLLTAVLAYQGIWMHQHGVGWAGQELYWGDRIRWIGLWDGANVLSLLFVVALPFVLEMVLGPRGTVSRLLGVVAGVLILVALFLAASRGAWLASGVVFLLYFRDRIGNKGIAVGVLAAAVLLAFAPERLTQGDDRDDRSWDLRLYMWSQGVEMLRYQPVLGVGKGRFLEISRRKIAHNIFVGNMAETGFVGLTVFVALIYYSFLSLMMAGAVERALSPPLASMRRAVSISLVGYLAASMFISTDFEPLYILMALCAVVLRLAQMETGLPLRLTLRRWDIRNILLLVVGGVLFTYAFTEIFWG